MKTMLIQAGTPENMLLYSCWSCDSKFEDMSVKVGDPQEEPTNYFCKKYSKKEELLKTTRSAVINQGIFIYNRGLQLAEIPHRTGHILLSLIFPNV